MPSLRRRLLNAVAAGRYEIRRPWGTEEPFRPEEQFFRRLLARLQPDCVLDIGANAGQFGQSLRDLGFEGLILSFEPNPVAFRKLQAAAASDDRWQCLPHAMGAKVGTMPFHVMEHDVFSSFLQPAAGADFSNLNVIAETIDATVSTLDSCFADLQAQYRFVNPFLKMDTQGFDLQVVRGGANVLNRFCALLSEVSVRPLYDGSPDITESISVFRAAGFDLTALFSVHPNMLLKVIEFNCYCVRRDLADAG